jgi:hypothetical protein
MHHLGIITDNNDPEMKGRAKIRIPVIYDNIEDNELP